MRRRLAFAICALIAAGELLALYLVYIHYRLHRDPGWESACRISNGVNCDSVILSPYGSVAGIPLAILGAWFYLVVGSVMALELRGQPRLFMRSPAIIVLAASALATATSVSLAVVSATSLATLCLLCAGLYVVSIGLLVVSWLALRSTGETFAVALKAEREHWGRHAFRSAAGVGLAIVMLLVMRAAYSSGTAGGSEICGAVAAALRPASSLPVEVKVYSDFQCPHCKAVDRDLRRLRRGRGLRVVPLHYPLDGECNPRVKRTRHPNACLQALSALCADAQGHGNEFSDRLFDEGPSSQNALVDLAQSLGLDRTGFEQCLDAGDTAKRLERSIEDAIAAGVRATPTIFVNGTRHTGRLDADDLRCLRAASERHGEDVRRSAGRRP